MVEDTMKLAGLSDTAGTLPIDRLSVIYVHKAQRELEGLLLLHSDQKRNDVVPTFFLHRLQDEPSNSERGYNSVKEPRNPD
jgi:hypothetical protein